MTLCSCLVWYGEGQCFVEQTLVAGALSAVANPNPLALALALTLALTLTRRALCRRWLGSGNPPASYVPCGLQVSLARRTLTLTLTLMLTLTPNPNP